MGETLSVMSALRAAVAFWRTTTPRVLGALGLFALVVAMAQIESALAVRPIWIVLTSLLEVAVSTLAYGALFRSAFAAEHPGDADFVLGPAGLQWGRTETRLLGATLLLILFYTLVILCVVFLTFLVAVAIVAVEGLHTISAASILNSPVEIFVSLVPLLCLIAMVWSSIRLSLAFPATADRQKVQVFSVWSLTKGKVWTLLGAGLICLLPGIVCGMLSGLMRSGSGAPVGLAVAIGVVVAGVTAFVQTPLIAGLYSHFYRLLRDRGALKAAGVL